MELGVRFVARSVCLPCLSSSNTADFIASGEFPVCIIVAPKKQRIYFINDDISDCFI